MNKSRFRLRFSRSLLVALVFSALVPGAFASWTTSRTHDGIVYFAMASPARIERYDLAQEVWLDPLTTSVSAQALAVDDAGIYFANLRETRRMNLDGSGEAPLFNAAQDVTHLESDGTYLFVMHPAYYNGYVTSIRLSDGQFIDTETSNRDFSAGYTIDPDGRALFGLNTRSTAFDINGVHYNEDGTFGSLINGPWGNGSFNEDIAALYISPDRRTLVRDTGFVYAAPSLTERGSLAGAVDDVVFRGNDLIVVLRGSQLVAYNGSLLAAGVGQFDQAVEEIELVGDTIYGFYADAAQDSGISVATIPFDSITAAEPGDALNPSLLAMDPDNVIAAGDDTFFLIDNARQSIFRWDAATFTFTQSLPLLGAPRAVAYSAAHDRLYIGYENGVINQIKLDENETVEVPFAVRPGRILGLQAADDLLFTVDDSGAWESFATYNTAGEMLHSREWSNYSREYIWSPTQRRMFYFRDGTSPNDLLYSVIGTDGTIEDDRDSPYHGDYSIRHPIRVSDDASGIMTGSGVLYSSTDLTVVGALANNFTDAVSRNNRWVTLREAGAGSQIQFWSQNNLFERGITLPGAPYRLFELSDERLLVMNHVNDRLVFSVVEPAETPVINSSPSLVSVTGTTSGYVGVPFELSVTVEGSGDLSYQWYRNSAPLEGQTGASLSIAEPTQADVGIYTVVVTSDYGSVASDAYSLVFEELPDPPSFWSQPSGRIANVGDYFYGFSVGVTAAGSTTYQWRFDGDPIEGATNSSYNPANNNRIEESDYGTYDVVVTDQFGRSATSAPAVLSAPTRTLGYSVVMRVPEGGATVTMVVDGGTQPVVVRALGPTRADAFAQEHLVDPVLSIYDSTGHLVGINDDWHTAGNAADLTSAADRLGMVPFVADSADAGLLRSLPAGRYTFHVEGADGGTGRVLFEIYDAAEGSSHERFPYLAVAAHVTPDDPLVAGVVYNNTGSMPLLLRGWGGATGRDGAVADPAVVWSSGGQVIGSNDDWSDGPDASAIASYVSDRGLAAFAANGRDAALFTPDILSSPANVASLVALEDSNGFGLLELVQRNRFSSSYNGLPPLVLVNPQPLQVVSGGNVVLSSRGSQASSHQYSWSLNGIPISGAIGDTVLLRNVDADDVGNYSVTVSTPGSSFTSIPVALNVVSEEVDQAVVATHSATAYTPGGTATVSVEVTFPEQTASLGWSTELPAGWSYVGGANEPPIAPASGSTGVLEWAWTEVPESPASFSFEVRPPVGNNGIQTLRAFALLRIDGSLIARLANPNPLLLRPASNHHRADTDGDGRLSLSELLRVIEIYNYRESSVRTGRYSLDAGAVDGFRPGDAGGALTEFHSADYNRDGKFSLSELLRVIELYNYRNGTSRTGQYHGANGTVDGFEAGP